MEKKGKELFLKTELVSLFGGRDAIRYLFKGSQKIKSNWQKKYTTSGGFKIQEQLSK
jgi:hypothetical protein